MYRGRERGVHIRARPSRGLAQREDETLDLRPDPVDHGVGELGRARMAAEVGRLDPGADRLERGVVDRPRRPVRARSALISGMPEHRSAGEDHRQRVREVLAHQRGRRAVRRLGHRHSRVVVLVEREQHRLGAGDRAEHRQDEIGQAVPIAIERRDHEWRVGRARQEAGVGGVDQHRLVGDVGVPGGGRVELLLEHPFVHGRDRPLRAAVHAGSHRGRGAERVLRDGAARRAGDPLGAEGHLVAARRRRPRATASAPYASSTAIRTTEIG